MHWAERRRLKAVFITEIWANLVGGVDFPIKREQIKKKLIITLYRRGRRYDQDNAYGACKPIIDSLRDLGLIWNDSKRWLDLDVRQELDHENPRTEIEILSFITDQLVKCECGWRGKVINTVPDVDGEGSLGCPKCLRRVIEVECVKQES